MRFCFKALSSLCGEIVHALLRPGASWARPVSLFTPECPPPQSPPGQLPGVPLGASAVRQIHSLPGGWQGVVPFGLAWVCGGRVPASPSRESTVALHALSGVREPRLAPLLAPGWWWWSGDPDCTAGSSPAGKGRLSQEQQGLTGLVHGPRRAGELQVLRPPRHLGLRDH